MTARSTREQRLAGRDRVAVVTGAAGGIGRAIASMLAAAGWSLALADRDAAGLAAVEAGLRGRDDVAAGASSALRDEASAAVRDEATAAGPGEAARVTGTPGGAAITTHVADLADADAPERLRDEVLAAHGRVHLLVNNAGVTVLGALEDQSRADVERVLGINLVAVAQLCRVFIPALVASAPSNIVNIASFAGAVAFPMQTTYSASKHGVRGLSAALRIELSDRGVGVAAVLPGTVATELMKGATSYDAAMSSTFLELMLRHGVPPEAVARAVRACIERGRAEVIVGWDAHLGMRLQRWLPSVVRAGFRSGWARYRSTRRGPV